MSACRIRENFDRINHRNPVSGHEWVEHGPTTTWSVVGPVGVVSNHRTEAGAQTALAEWEAFYAKHPLS
jgi:hypothetical protein